MGLSRQTIGERLRILTEAHFIQESSDRVSSGGRPATVLKLNPMALLVLCFDVTETFTRVAVADLSAAILVEEVIPTNPTDGPVAVLAQLSAAGRTLLARSELTTTPLGAVSISLPARVNIGTGATVGWSVLVGWEGFSVTDHLTAEFGVPTLVDNDVSLLVLAERHLFWRSVNHLLLIKVGTGVGGALIVNGEINRGYEGAAGDIGHIYVSGFGDPMCRCGNTGCLEAVAGGWALQQRLEPTARASTELDIRKVADAISSADPQAMVLIREASRAIGMAAAAAANLLNPQVIVIAGEVAKAAGHLLIAGVTAEVYQRSLPLATQSLEISPSRLDEHGGLIGPALLASSFLLDPDRIDRLVAPLL